MPANNASRANEHLLRAAADDLGCNTSHLPCVFESLGAGAGVGIARANDDAAGVAARQPFLTNAHGSGTHAIASENAGRRRGPIADHQSQIETGRIRPQASVNAGKSITV